MQNFNAPAKIADGVVYPGLVSEFLAMPSPPRIQSARRGETIVMEGGFANHSMLLLEGWIALSKMLPDGDTQIIDVMLPGDFALIGAPNASVAACSVDCLSDTRFMVFQSAQFNGPEPQMAKLRDLLVAMVATTQARTAELVLRKGNSSAANLVAYALLEFYVRLGSINLVLDRRFPFPITQQKLGEFIGLSNVHVCRTMRRFERDKIISYLNHTEIILHDVDALCQIAGIDLELFREEILVQRTI